MHALQPADVLIGGSGEGHMGDYDDLVRPVGKGKFSVVYRATRKVDGITVALKKITAQMMDEKSRTKCLKEVRLLQSVDHPNVIRCLDSFLEDNTLVIVFEWAAAGDLKRQIRKALEREQHLYERAIWGYLCQICEAIRYMHSQRIMHRDLKPANIFLTLRGQVKVGDLGLGIYLGEGTGEAHSKVGTPLYMSPEVLRGGGYSWKSDVWSLGCIMYELAMLRNPFKAEDMNLYSLWEKISKGDYPPLLDYYSEELRALACSMMSTDPQDRPDIGQVCTIANETKQKSDSIDACPPPPEIASHLKLKTLPPRTERRVSAKKGGGDRAVAPASTDSPATSRRLLTTVHTATECTSRYSRRGIGAAAPLDDKKRGQQLLSSRRPRRLRDGKVCDSDSTDRAMNYKGDGRGDGDSQAKIGAEGADACVSAPERRIHCRHLQLEWDNCQASPPTVGKSMNIIGPGNSNRKSGGVRNESYKEACRGAMVTPLTEEEGPRWEIDLCKEANPSGFDASAPMDDRTLGELMKGSRNAAIDSEGKLKPLELMSLRGDTKRLAMAGTNAETRWKSGGSVRAWSLTTSEVVEHTTARTPPSSAEAPSERLRERYDAGTSTAHDGASCRESPSQSGETEHEATSSGDGLIAAATAAGNTPETAGKADPRSSSPSHRRSHADLVVANVISNGIRGNECEEADIFRCRPVDGAGSKPPRISRHRYSVGGASGASISERQKGGNDEYRGVVNSVEDGAKPSTVRDALRPEYAYYGTGVVTGGILVAMETLYDRLTILGYDLDLRRRGKRPLSRLHFTLPIPCSDEGGNKVGDIHWSSLTTRQPFLEFVTLSEWLLGRLSDNGKGGANYGCRSHTSTDTPTTVCAAILGSCQREKALGFEPQPGLIVLPKSLAPGYGAAVLELLTWLAQAAVLDARPLSHGNVKTSRSLLERSAENHSSPHQRKVDSKADDNASLETDSAHRASFWTEPDVCVTASSASLSLTGSPPELPWRARFSSEASSCFLGGGASKDETIGMESMIKPRVDPTAWRMELERMAPKLKAATRRCANDSWEYRLDVLRKEAATAAVTASRRTPSAEDRAESSISGRMWRNRGAGWPLDGAPSTWTNGKTNRFFSSSKKSKQIINGFGSTSWTMNTIGEATEVSQYWEDRRTNSCLRTEEYNGVELRREVAIPWGDKNIANVADNRKGGSTAASQFRVLDSMDVAWMPGSGEELNELNEFHFLTSSECEGVVQNMVEGLWGALSRQLETVTAGERMVNAQRGLEPLRKESLDLRREKEKMRAKLQRQKARIIALTEELEAINQAVDEVDGKVKDAIDAQANPSRPCKMKAAVRQLKSDAKAMDVFIGIKSTAILSKQLHHYNRVVAGGGAD